MKLMEYSVVENGEHIEGGVYVLEYPEHEGKTLIALAYTCGLEVEVDSDGTIKTKGQLESVKQFYAELSAFQIRREHLEKCLEATSENELPRGYRKRYPSYLSKIKNKVKSYLKRLFV